MILVAGFPAAGAHASVPGVLSEKAGEIHADTSDPVVKGNRQ
jgi:hypothetical protein